MSLEGILALVTGASKPRGIGSPQEVADAIAYACSDSAAHMTGAIMNMMGGLDLFVF